MHKTLKTILLGLSICVTCTAYGQVSQKKKPVFYEIDAAMHKYVKDSLRYPVDAPAEGLPSSIVVRFTINTKGEIENPILVRKGHPSCDAEALRLVKAMPKREASKTPANYMLPIVFGRVAKKEESTPSSSSTDQTDQEDISSTASSQEVFMLGDDGFQTPSFPGGDFALAKFIQQNLRYPVEAQDSGVQGKVVVKFTVEKDGAIKDIQVSRSVHPLLDKEALRVVKMMPKWTPAKARGHLVRATYVLPISFRLED